MMRKRALEPFDDDENESFTAVPCVPRPHGEDAGEKSLKTEIEQNIELYRFAILMDKHGRRSINRVFDGAEETTGNAVAPTFLLYLLLDKEECTVEEFVVLVARCFKGKAGQGIRLFKQRGKPFPSIVRGISRAI